MKRYRIISELGKGATGVVYKAVHPDDATTVALKKLVLPGHLDEREEEEFINRFKSEAKAALELKHAGIVGALDCGLDQGTFYIAYELIQGVTLEDALKSGRKFTPEEVTDIIAQTSDALAYAHKQGVVHRDLSPGNIFLTSDGKARISDFGVAGFTSRATITSGQDAIVGTPGYMAPEQIKGSEPDPRSDVFSLGCVAYELLTGNKAFSGDNLAQIIHRVMNEQPIPIRDINPAVTLALEEFVFRMLAKNPDYRYQGMDEVNINAVRVLDEIPRGTKKEKLEATGHAPVLVAVSGPYEGKTYNLQPTVTTIGSSIGDILLSDDGEVASQHAWITKEDTSWFLYDADTEDGTFLNGEKIEREEVLPGDRIRLGETTLEFRGAGGHVGAFEDKGEEAEAVKKGPEITVPVRRIPWTIIILLVLPGLVVIAGLVMIGVVLPSQHISRLNDATNQRWDDAFRLIDQTALGNPEWTMDVLDVLDDWNGSVVDEDDGTMASGIGQSGDYMAPGWVIGDEKINERVLYRFTLFQLAEEFLIAVAGQPMTSVGIDDEAPDLAPDASRTVRAIEPRISNLEVPESESADWEGRKHQLLSIVRRWLASSIASSGTARQGSYALERQTAQEAILTGWYTLQGAGNNVGLLSTAFDQVATCIGTLDQVLLSSPGDREALALRGLANFLSARIKRRAGNILGPDRYVDALQFLDEAESDMQGISQETWDRAIPADFHDEFPSPQSLNAQNRALRLTLSDLIASAQPQDTDQ